MPKPSDFFIGVTELFAILIPGFIVLAGLNWILEFRISEPGQDTWNWICILIGSYLVGAVFFAIGARFDRIYDRYMWADKDGGQPRPRGDSPALQKVKDYRATLSNDLSGKVVNNYKWSRSLLQAHRPVAWTEVLRAETDSKLFRSLVIPLLILAVLWAVKGSADRSWFLAVIPLLMAVIAFIRYWKLRTKACIAAYEHVLVFAGTQKEFGGKAGGQ